MKRTHLRGLLLVILLLACFWVVHAQAREITGTISATRGERIMIELPDGPIPKVGDPVVVFYMIGEDRISVGKWRVTAVQDKTATAEIIEAEGSATIGMTAVIISDPPVWEHREPQYEKQANQSFQEKGNLGIRIRELDENLRRANNVPGAWNGVVVLQVNPGSAGEKAGLAVHDVIVSVDNQPVDSLQHFLQSIKAKNAGETVNLFVLSQGQPKGLVATLDAAAGTSGQEQARAGVTQPKENEKSGLENACLSGEGLACFKLAGNYSNGSGVSKDKAAALGYYQKSCEYGYSEACNHAGVLHKGGVGTPKDPLQSAYWYQKGCDLGNARSCNNLGLQYANGEGLAKDDGRASVNFEKSCSGGNQAACSNLGNMYKTGRGVPKDKSRAIALFRQSCNGGEKLGCANLGSMYVYGDGVEKDLDTGRTLLQQSCNDGLQWSCDQLKKIPASSQIVQPAPKASRAVPQTTRTVPQTRSIAQQQRQQEEQERQNRKAAREMLPGLIELQRQMIDMYNKK